MERLQIIRETINYTHQFYSSRFVVKIDNKVSAYALERIYSDIDKIRQTGIEVIATCLSDEVATNIALEQKAQKLIFVTRVRGVFFPRGTLLKQLSIGDVRELLAKPKAVNGSMRGKLEASIKACNCGIDRVHIIGREAGNLLLEIFTCDGTGTMIYSKIPYERIRRAEASEINDIIEILRATISKSCFDSALVSKSISNFWVFSVDGDIHGCMQLVDRPNYKMIEIFCLAVTARYENLDTIQRLLKHAREYAGAKNRKGVFINIKDNTLYLPLYPWFMRLGFKRDSSSQISLIDKNAGMGCWISVL